jgi:ATP-dependent Lhr-like helicase
VFHAAVLIDPVTEGDAEVSVRVVHNAVSDASRTAHGRMVQLFASWRTDRVMERMEAQGLNPMGFVATDYATLIWGLDRVTDPAPLLAREGLQVALEGWLAENAVMKRTFKSSAIVAGLIDRNSPGGKRKSGRQATFSTDILYDTLRKYDPGHLMLDITRAEAMRGLVDFGRVEEMLDRIGSRIDHVALTRVTPLAAPLFLEVGKVPVKGSAEAVLIERERAALMQAAGLA